MISDRARQAAKDAARSTSRRNWPLFAMAGIVVAAVAAFAVLYFVDRAGARAEQEALRAQVSALAADAKAVAAPLDQLCATDPSVRDRAGEASCRKAAEVQQQPPPVVVNGKDGRGITSTAIIAGRLRITYSDGLTEDKGQVVGDAGAAGVAGRGITASTIDAGRLVLVYSDGAREDVGQVVGAQGETGSTGPQGATGRGISSVDGTTGRLVITYTDGTTEDAGPLPPGPAGPRGADGRGVQRAYVEGCRWHVVYTDGTSEDAGNACTTETVSPPVGGLPTTSTGTPGRNGNGLLRPN